MASEKPVGSLEVHVQQARDIQNICIYHKQDVYARLCLTSDPEASVSSKIINGGGRNPVFDDRLHLDVFAADSSLKCEIWMLSRVKNYLKDQLLGFALVPLPEIARNGGKLSGEFSLSATDLFHSPAGFVQLSVTYSGPSADLITGPRPPAGNVIAPSGDGESDIPCEYETIEFPDLEIVDENNRMVSEVVGIPCGKLEVEPNCSEYPDSGAGLRLLDCISSESQASPSAAADCNSNDTSINAFASASMTEPSLTAGSSEPEDKIAEAESPAKPPAIIKIDATPEPGVVRQDIVDLYMKSMQQFTESLAKMKLPMDVDNSGGGGGEKINGEEKSRAPEENSSRVFYGSSAFF